MEVFKNGHILIDQTCSEIRGRAQIPAALRAHGRAGSAQVARAARPGRCGGACHVAFVCGAPCAGGRGAVTRRRTHVQRRPHTSNLARGWAQREKFNVCGNRETRRERVMSGQRRVVCVPLVPSCLRRGRAFSLVCRARGGPLPGEKRCWLLRARVLMLLFASEDNERAGHAREPRAGFRRPFSTFGLHARTFEAALFSRGLWTFNRVVSDGHRCPSSSR